MKRHGRDQGVQQKERMGKSGWQGEGEWLVRERERDRVKKERV